MNIAVTGAGGWLGSEIIQNIQKLDQHICTPIDRPGAIDNCKNWDCTSSSGNDDIKNALNGCQSVIHCAGLAHRPNEDESTIALMNLVNEKGTEQVVNAAKNNGIKRFVYVSTIASYDWTSGIPANENSKQNPTTAYAKSKLAGEDIVRNSGLNWRIVRLATVYGNGDRANFSRLASALKRKHFVLPKNSNSKKSIIPVNLAAELIADLAIRNDIQNTLVNLGLPQPVSLQEIVDVFCRACGFHNPINIPYSILKTIAFGGNIIEKTLGKSPLTTNTLKKLTQSTVVDCSRMQKIWPNKNWPTFEQTMIDFAEYYTNI